MALTIKPSLNLPLNARYSSYYNIECFLRFYCRLLDVTSQIVNTITAYPQEITENWWQILQTVS